MNNNDLEWTIFETTNLPPKPKGRRFLVFETHRRELSREFKKLDDARAWLIGRGFAPNKACTWTVPGDNT
jgi:hypothetical protein